MTTDTAVRVTRTIIQNRSMSIFYRATHSSTFRAALTVVQETLSEIPYVDNPEIRINEHESVEMPFRYMTDVNGLPIMPKVSQLGELSFQLSGLAYFLRSGRE